MFDTPGVNGLRDLPLGAPRQPERLGEPQGRRDLRRFLRRQARAIRTGGLPALARMGLLALATAAAVPIVLVVRLLRPWVVIQFGGMNVGALGPLATAMVLYLCERDEGWYGRRVVPVVWCVNTHFVCNRQLVAMWKRLLFVHPFARTLDRVNRLIPGWRPHRIRIRSFDRDPQGLLATAPAHLRLTADEERQGREGLRALGIAPGTPLVCFSARDEGWSRAVPGGLRTPMAHRYSDIRTYLPAIQALVWRGYVAVRMGANVQQPLPSDDPRIIDYATRARSDFMDVFLCAHGRFFLGDSGSLINVPMVFRRPLAQVNAVHLEHIYSWGPDDLIIPKKLWRRDEHRFLTFREILVSGVGRLLNSEQYAQRGIEVIDNTPEEIRDLVVEMDDRLNGLWRATPDDEALQGRFWDLIRRHNGPHGRGNERLHGVIRARIGAHFLREHRAWLD